MMGGLWRACAAIGAELLQHIWRCGSLHSGGVRGRERAAHRQQCACAQPRQAPHCAPTCSGTQYTHQSGKRPSQIAQVEMLKDFWCKASDRSYLAP